MDEDAPLTCPNVVSVPVGFTAEFEGLVVGEAEAETFVVADAEAVRVADLMVRVVEPVGIGGIT